jgi:hypothetical protein
MKSTGKLQVTTPTDREIVLTRVFDAPRRLVFDAFTKPELLAGHLAEHFTVINYDRRGRGKSTDGAQALARILANAQYSSMEGRDHSAVLLAPKPLRRRSYSFYREITRRARMRKAISNERGKQR